MKILLNQLAGRRARVGPAVLVLALAVGSVWGQTPPPAAPPAAPPPDTDLNRRFDQIQRETRLLASPDLSAGDRALIDYGAYLTLSYFSTDTSLGDNRSLRQYDLNLYAHLNFDGAHEVYVRNRLQYRDYSDGDQTATDDDGLQSFLEEAYYKFSLSRYLAAYKGENSPNDLTLTVGRQFVDWGTGLVLDQYLDAGKLELKLGNSTTTLLGGVTTYGTTDFDYSRPDFDKSTYRGFYGAMESVSVNVGETRHEPFAYVLVQRDYNKGEDLDLGAGGKVRFDYNSIYLGLGSTGNLTDHLRYTLEGVFEAGSTLDTPVPSADALSSTQSRSTIAAWAGQAGLEYLFADAHNSKVGETFIVASGDPDRTSSSATFGGNSAGQDHAFNGLGLVSAGYAFAPTVSNLAVLKTSASTFPFLSAGSTKGIWSRLQVGTDVLVYAKTRTSSPIDESTDEKRYLGTEGDLFLNWRILEDVTFQGRYGVFVPGAAIQGNDVRQFLYTSITYSF